MKNIFLVLGLFLGFTAMSQSSGENYIKTLVYKSDSTSLVDTLVNIQYFDGLGRAKQTVAVKAGGTGKDIVTPIVYDGFGREEKKYLPYADPGVSSLNYRPNSSLIQTDNGLGLISSSYISDYQGDLSSVAPNPYSQTRFENSPLNRVLEQGAPGASWKLTNTPDSNHSVKFNYRTNTLGEVLCFKVLFAQENGSDKYDSTTLQYTGRYAPNQLTVTITRDENWTGQESDADAFAKSGVVKEYKDKEGHVVLKRTYNGSIAHDTYYVYDDYGNLAYVIPPLASSQVLSRVEGRQSAGRNYPWTMLTEVDEDLAKKYEQTLEKYKNEEILNVDLQSEYGGSGGFSIYIGADGGLTMTINIVTSAPMPLRNGVIVDLKEFGEFKDKEIGRISGVNYEYVFLIIDNTIVVKGGGKVSSITAVLEDNTKLAYSAVFPVTKFLAMDPVKKDNYEADFYKQLKDGVENPLVDNDLGIQGKISVSLTASDILSVSVNLTANDSISLASGASFSLPFERKIDDVLLGQSQGYTLRVLNNNLVIEGIGSVLDFNLGSVISFTTHFEVNTAIAENGLCYIYHYDDRNRLVEKFIPDNGWTYIVYDRLDRPILTQDENLRASQKRWLLTKYDCFDRTVYTGVCVKYSQTRQSLQDIANQWGVLSEQRLSTTVSPSLSSVYYTNEAFPTDSDDRPTSEGAYPVYTVNYYDTYPEYDGTPDYYLPPATVYGGAAVTAATKGLTTVSLTKVLDTSSWISSVVGYDKKARPIYLYTNNAYLKSKHTVESKLDFLGKPETVITTHEKGTQAGASVNWVTTVLKDDFTYDHTGRLLTQFQQVNNSGQYNLIAKNEYDKYGQLQKKYVGGVHASGIFSSQVALQQVDYTYNIRGWLKGINSINGVTATSDDLFAFGINYNLPTHSNSTALYNGNISETFWKSRADNYEKSYVYKYDGLNRLLEAHYDEMTINSQHYYEGPIKYDKNGNITSLERFGLDTSDNTFKIIDQLSYHYNPLSNRLGSVNDTAGTSGFKDVNNGGDDYAYDLNGNMISDVNKGILNITYNHLNLPVLITFSGDNKNIEYTYNAAGVKQTKKVTDGQNNITITQYDGGFVYENSSLKFFSHPEGYVNCENNTFTYVYQYKDHLGNIRLSYKGTHGNLSIEEQNDYYPFGMKHGIPNEVVNSTNIALKYKYNGKELQDELGLNMYDYGARNYDPALGMWMNIDPLAEVSRRWSPYNYCYDNPVVFVDPDGMKVSYGEYIDNAGKPDYNWETGEYRSGSLEGAIANADRNNGATATANDGGGDKPNIFQRAWNWLFGGKKHNNDIEVGPIEPTPAQNNYENDFNSYLSNKFLNDFSFGDAIWHYRLGNGAPVNVNLSSLDFSEVKVSDFDTPEFIHEGAPGIWVRFDNKKDYANPSQALIYGTVDVVYIGKNRIMVLPNTYDFDLKLEEGSFKRDFATMMGGMYNGAGTPYVIYFNGTTKISD